MKTKDVFMYSLGGLIVIGFFATTIYLITTKANNDALMLILGALIGAFSTVVGYFYGSSKGSSDKNELLNKQQ